MISADHTVSVYFKAVLFCIHSLASCDRYHLVDVIYRAAAAEVVYRTGDTLEDRTDCICTTESLNELVSDVTYLEAWEYKYICMTCDL